MNKGVSIVAIPNEPPEITDVPTFVVTAYEYFQQTNEVLCHSPSGFIVQAPMAYSRAEIKVEMVAFVPRGMKFDFDGFGHALEKLINDHCKAQRVLPVALPGPKEK